MLIRTTIELDLQLQIFEDLIFYCRLKSCEVFEEPDIDQFLTVKATTSYMDMLFNKVLYERFYKSFQHLEWQNAWPKRRQEMFEYYFKDTLGSSKPYQEIYDLLGRVDVR